LGSDVVNNNATPDTLQDVTGLSFPVVAGTYRFKAIVDYTSATTTTGSRWTINGDVAATRLAYSLRFPLTNTTNTAYNGVAYEAGIVSATSLTTGNICMIEGMITVSGAGTIIVRFSSEVASSAITAKAGSFLTYRKVA